MNFAWLSSVLFFALLCIAALTSTISLMEVSVAFLCEATEHTKHPLNRRKSVTVTSIIVMALIALCVCWDSVFGAFDEITACVLMPLGAMGMALFVGWNLPKDGQKGVFHADKGIKRWLRKLFIFFLRFVVPIAILVVFLNSLGVL
jgi:NSS family neurotransmitter:Na+ symporter